jgi:hypothetical protein
MTLLLIGLTDLLQVVVIVLLVLRIRAISELFKAHNDILRCHNKLLLRLIEAAKTGETT